MEEGTITVLELMGFENSMSTIWRHKTTARLISVKLDTKPEELLQIFLEAGSDDQNERIKKVLGIREK